MHGFLSFLPRSYVKFVVKSNLSTCDTTRLQFLRTPAYSKVLLSSPPSSPPTHSQNPDSSLDLPLSSQLAPGPGPLPGLAVPAPTQILGSSPLTLRPCPSKGAKNEGASRLRSKRRKRGSDWGLGPERARQAPRGPARGCTPGLSKPRPPPPFLLPQLVFAVTDHEPSSPLCAPFPGDVKGRHN